MKSINTNLDGVYLIEPKVFCDERGWFTESFSSNKMNEIGICNQFIQDNHSLSLNKGTLRGLHFQINPMSQAKLVRCTRGKILDVVVDIREGSPNYLKWISVELSEKNKKQLFVPRGFAHGFLTLEDNTEVQYKVDEYYSSEHDRSIRYDDDSINIDWGIENPILSDKDKNAKCLNESDANFKYKYLVMGANGQLGKSVVKALETSKSEFKAVSKEELDIKDYEQVKKEFENFLPDVVINCAAYTDVNMAEKENAACYEVNVTGVENIVRLCKRHMTKLIHISSDYVYGDNGSNPLKESDAKKPVNYYGKSKLDSEKIIENNLERYYIIRTSWLYGDEGNNFVNTIYDLVNRNADLKIINDQIGAPTNCDDLAKLIYEISRKDQYGVYNVSNQGYCSWYDIAVVISSHLEYHGEIVPVSTKEYGSKTMRQLNSRLDNSKLLDIGLVMLPNWEDSLDRFLKNKSDRSI